MSVQAVGFYIEPAEQVSRYFTVMSKSNSTWAIWPRYWVPNGSGVGTPEQMQQMPRNLASISVRTRMRNIDMEVQGEQLRVA
eukprot:1536853-Pyramimonas_sp.AAC.1